MGEAFETYLRVKSGELNRFPKGFWKAPQGVSNLIEIIRILCDENEIHPSEVKKFDLINWNLESPLVTLFNGSMVLPRKLAEAGIPKKVQDEERQRKNSASRSLTNSMMSEVWIRDDGRCVECGSMENLEFDHMIPFSKGGATSVENLRLLCRSCNRSRGNNI